MSLRLRNLLRSTRLQIKERSYAQLRLFSQGSNSGSYRAEIWQTDGAGRQREEKGRIRRNEWKCLCSCGQEKEIRQDALVSGAAASCGCVKSRGNEKVARLLREAGLSYQPEYSPPDMKGKRRFDFAVWEAGKLSYLIEYDGVLHFGYSDSG